MVRPSDTGYAIDVAATADRALAAGREGTLGGAWSTLEGFVTTRRIAPVPAIDRRRTSARHRSSQGEGAGFAVASGGCEREIYPTKGRTTSS